MPVIRTRRPGTSARALGRGARAPAPGARRGQPLLDRVQAPRDRPQLLAQVLDVVGGGRAALLDRAAPPVPDGLGARLCTPDELVDRVLCPRPRGLRPLARGLQGAFDRVAASPGAPRRSGLA